MNRLVRAIIRLYPSQVRGTYGPELEDAALRQMHDRHAARQLWIVFGLLLNAVGAWLDVARSITGAPWAHVRHAEGLAADVRAVVRGLMSAPFYTSTVVATLALGVGVNAAVFSIVNGVVLRSLPYNNPGRLVRVHAIDPRNGDRYRPITPGHLDVIRKASSIERAVGTTLASQPLIAGSAAREVEVARVDGDVVSLLGLKIARGRAPTVAEWERGESVVLLAHGLWRSMFGEDLSVVGKFISLANRSYTVVGVLAAGSLYPPSAEVLRPMTLDERADGDPDLAVLARLAADVSRLGVEEELRRRTRSYLAAGVAELPGLQVWIEDARSTLVRQTRGPLFLIQAAALGILLVTCLNLAHLLLVRGEVRRGELAVRAAMGARRSHLVRLLMLESLGLVVMGGIVGVLSGRAALPLLLKLMPAGTPRLDNVVMDVRVLMWLLGLAAIVFFTFALGPALHSSAVAPSMALAKRGIVGRSKREWASRSLVIAEVAFSTVLVTAAVLLAVSLARVATLDRGYDAGRLLYLPLSPADGSVKAQGGLSGYEEMLLDQVRALPGVEAAALATHAPASMKALNFGLFRLKGPSVSPDDRPVRGGVAAVSDDYFRAVGLRILEGRVFTAADAADSEPVAVASRAFARAFLDRGEGATLKMRDLGGGTDVTRAVRIIGVVEDTRPVADEPPPELLYMPLAQIHFGANLVVRVAGDVSVATASIRAGLQRFDPRLPTNRLSHLANVEQVETASFQAWLVGLFAGLALTVAVIGIYGVTTYTVERRIPEFGVRRALGATGASVHKLVLRSAVALAGIGVALGLAGAVAMSELLRGLLFGVSPLEPAALGGVAIGLAFVGVLAAWIPAARASRVPPARALYGE